MSFDETVIRFATRALRFSKRPFRATGSGDYSVPFRRGRFLRAFRFAKRSFRRRNDRLATRLGHFKNETLVSFGFATFRIRSTYFVRETLISNPRRLFRWRNNRLDSRHGYLDRFCDGWRNEITVSSALTPACQTGLFSPSVKVANRAATHQLPCRLNQRRQAGICFEIRFEL